MPIDFAVLRRIVNIKSPHERNILKRAVKQLTNKLNSQNESLFHFSVGQNQPQEHTYPPQGYSAPPQQLQPYPPQGYSAQPQQAQTYTQPSAPTAYPYPPGQEVYPPQTATSAHQHSSDTGEPPSYDEVTKQKK